MPDSIKDILYDSLSACVQEIAKLQETDSRDYGSGTAKFTAIHYSWYNRMTTKVYFNSYYQFLIINSIIQGHDMPKDIHPLFLIREDGTRINYSQFLPYFSKEGYEHQETLVNLQTVFADLFAFIRTEVSIEIFYISRIFFIWQLASGSPS